MSRFCSSYPRCSLLGLTLLSAGLASLCPRAVGRGESRPKGIEAEHGMVVSVSEPGSAVGLEILKKGGNAVDAAVATAFALAVTYPQAGNIGGGGFMVIYPAAQKGTIPLRADAKSLASGPVVIDYREAAPSAATKTMFSKHASWYGHKVVGVPGTVRGLALAHRLFGQLPWKEVVLPAVRLAEEGFILNESLANSLNWIVCTARDFPELGRVYGKDAGRKDWQEGDLLIQKELAATLRVIAEQGADAFYQGAIADQIAAEMKAGGGLITKADLAAYQAKARAPIHGTYRGYDIYGPRLPVPEASA